MNALNSGVRNYLSLFAIFLLVGLALFFIVAAPPTENAPKGPVEIGVGPMPDASINKTEMQVNVPENSIDVRVTFRFSEIKEYFIYAIFPYRISDAKPYAIYHSSQYPNSELIIGNFSKSFMNTAYGSSIVNVKLSLNSTFSFHFGDPDLTDELTLSVSVTFRDSLVAMNYRCGASQTVILTLFGDVGGAWSDDMLAFMQPSSQITIGQPFVVFLRIPSQTYFSESQPSPIMYYVKEGQRWIMFSMDFLGGRYAQTLFCTFTNPTMDAWGQILVFTGGVFVAISVSFLVEIIKDYAQTKKSRSTRKNRRSKSGNTAEIQPSDVRKLIELVDGQFQKSLWRVKLNALLPDVPFLVMFLFITYMLYIMDQLVLAAGPSFSPEIQISIVVALAATMIAFASFAIDIAKILPSLREQELLVDVNYKRLKNQVNESDRPLLRALIMLKSKQPQFDLKDVQNQDLFRADRLWEKLYE